MIQRVKHLPAELQAQRLTNSEALEKSEVEVPASGSDQGVSACVSVAAQCRESECAGVKILFNEFLPRASRAEMRVADQARPLGTGPGERAVLTAYTGKGRARLDRQT